MRNSFKKGRRHSFSSGFDYHRFTEHVRGNLQSRGLDWAARPTVFKEYPDLGPVEIADLPQDISLPDLAYTPLSRVLRASPLEYERFSIEQLSSLLLLGINLTAKTVHPGGEFHFRSVPSAGALYPCELYLAATGIPGMSNGIFHYDLKEHKIERIRTGDFLPEASYLCAREAPEPSNGIVLFLTAVFFRSAWKYADRSYRYILLDSGHMAENFAFSLQAQQLHWTPTYDFDDQGIADLLKLKPEDEGCIAAFFLDPKSLLPSVAPAQKPAVPGRPSSLHSADVRDELNAVLAFHDASSEPPKQSKLSKSRKPRSLPFGLLNESYIPIPPPKQPPTPLSHLDVLRNRRSKRNYSKNILSLDLFFSLLHMICEPMPRFPLPDMVKVAIAAQRIEDKVPGLYMLNSQNARLALVRRGQFHRSMAEICLNQHWLGNAALHFCFFADLRHLDHRYGPRGYRYAMLTAGRLGQRVYAAATALGLGACGVGAFYDQEASDYLELADTERLLYVVAVGPVKK